MTTRASTLGDDLKTWAVEQLGLQPGHGADAVLRAYLRQVQHDNGNPNLTAREALLILTRQLKSARPTLALEAAEEALQREVDDFARRFFDRSVADRKAEWENLKARGLGFVRANARIGALRAGVGVVVPNGAGDSVLGELIATICTLFVLRPAARAAARQAWLHEAHANGQWDAWVKVAVRLRERDPALAALEPELVGSLVDACGRAAERVQLQRRMRKAARAIPRAASGESTGSSWGWRLAPLALILCTTLLRSTNCNSSVPRPQLPAPQDREILEIIRKHQHELQQNKAEARPGPDGGGRAIDQAVRDLKKRKKQPEPGAAPKDRPKLP